MRAVVFHQFQGPLSVTDLPEPAPTADGVVIRVQATGLCRSDWHGWMGHDSDVRLPHVPGHEFAGTIAAVGKDVRYFRPGDRVTAPFSIGCGECSLCCNGRPQICDNYFQPGFTANGSFAELVAIPHADFNLVRLPDALASSAAAALGCRYGTAFHALTAQAPVTTDQWLAVHGCGGVGLAAIQLGRALTARVVAIDVRPTALELARQHGADETVLVDPENNSPTDVGRQVQQLTGGGADVSMDAMGGLTSCRQSIASLRKGGTHVQVGLMAAAAAEAPLPMKRLIAEELRVVGSHGIAAAEYPALLKLIAEGMVDPGALITDQLPLEAAIERLPKMDQHGYLIFCLDNP